ncbi:hypothetical protein, conserved [Angomonas deanei]|uniref:Uncharacterized protein n=1 Tax=Angomonas deanei TaxID=59799 RepID=A0A7G2CT61_9TRYP|nr:hypothetical protein, conserved [Angomonas deanei]
MFHHDSPYQVNEEARQATRQRHRERVQALFTRLLDTFVTDPDLYHCAATLFFYLDGPLESYRYRQKELRACQQKEHWERDETKFKRTVECLESLFHDATEASELLKERLLSNDHPSEEDQKHVLEALVQLQSNVKAVLEASEEHMGQTASYEGVRDLAKRVRDAVREAKSTFILS